LQGEAEWRSFGASSNSTLALFLLLVLIGVAGLARADRELISAFSDDSAERRGRASQGAGVLAGSAQWRVDNLLADLFLELDLLFFLDSSLDLALVLKFDQLKHVVILLNRFKLLGQSRVLSVLTFGDGMIIDLFPLSIELFLDQAGPVLHGLHLVLLLLDAPLPIALHLLLLLVFVAQHLVELKELVLQVALILLHLVVVGAQRCSLVLDHRLRLLDLLHVVLHLVLEIAFEETQQVLLDVDFLDLTVDGLQLTVHLGVLHFAQAAQLTSHFDDLIFFLVQFVLLALLLDLSDDPRLNQVEFDAYLEQAAVLLDEQREDVAGLLSEVIATHVDTLQSLDELQALAQQVARLVAQLVLTQIDALQRKLRVLEAGADELFDAIQFYPVSAHVQHLQPIVLEQALADSQHDFFTDSAVSDRQMRQVAAAAQDAHEGFRQVEARRLARLLRNFKVVAIQNEAAERHVVVIGEGREQRSECHRLALHVLSEVETAEGEFAVLFEDSGELLHLPIAQLVIRKIQLLQLAIVNFEDLQ